MKNFSFKFIRRFLPLAAALGLQLACTVRVQSQLIDVDFNTNSAPPIDGGPAIGPTMSGAAVLGAAGDKWNGIDISSGSGIPLSYANGSNSPVTMTFTAGGGYDARTFGGSTPFVGTPFDALTEDYLYSGGTTQTVVLAGLEPRSAYNLVLYNAGDSSAAGRKTWFMVNSSLQSSTWNGSSSTLIAGTNYFKFTNAMSDSSGDLVMNWSGNGTAEGDLDGFQIQAQTGQADHGLDATFAGTGKTLISFGAGEGMAVAVAIQPDGRIVAAGQTNNGAGVSALALARLNTDGSPDLSFGVNGQVITPGMANATAVAIQSDGKIIAAGGNTGFGLARYNSNGSLDSSFGTNGIANAVSGGTAQAVGIQSDGKIVVVGNAPGEEGADFALARFNTNGTLDTSFGRAGEVATPIENADAAYGMGIQPDGKIVGGGFAGTLNSASTITELDFAAARYLPSGALDLSFGSLGRTTGNVGGGSYDLGYAAAIQPDGKVIVAGTAALQLPSDLSSFVALMRFNTNGMPDTTFGNDGAVVTEIGNYSDEALALAVQPDGRILVAGASENENINEQWFVQRLNSDGSPDSTYGDDSVRFVNFDSGTNELAYAIAMDSSSRAVVAGDAGGLFGVARLLPDAATVSVSLKISLTATNTVVILWPYPSAGWNLQQNSGTATTNWVTPPETINNDGTNNFIIVSPQSGTLFYRLKE
ncbi:MAG TPA: hypothetical protein VH280_08105 [Verrucomicrobiae bacterium]|jgi:uncharacterized delta-60 repeat protein|nr:hypothetical protein [Verrucomicrobiae bacterium]